MPNPSYVKHLLTTLLLLAMQPACSEDSLTAQAIIEKAAAAVFSPYIYEEQMLVLTDNKQHHSVRQGRFYQRSNRLRTDTLMVFDSPEEIHGVAVRIVRQAQQSHTDIYFPAYEKGLLSTSAEGQQTGLLGTDLTWNDLLPEKTDQFHYRFLPEVKIDEQAYYQIEAGYIDPSTAPMDFYYRRFLVRKDIGRITRVEDLDKDYRLRHVRSEHRFVDYGNNLWLPSMILIEDLDKQHSTLLKVNRRIFSPDYVPAEIFTDQWLLSNQHKADTAQHLFNRISSSVLTSADLIHE